jgi:tRNA (guanine37-N1)-methyltransferase
VKISIITLFPNQIKETLETSMLGRAQKQGLVDFQIIDLRTFGEGVHQVVDGKPYGGGPGMLFRADILAKAVKSIKGKKYTILTSPVGKQFNQMSARKLLAQKHLLIICGHYEGVDQRFIDKYVDAEISIGDYVLTGGELPALVITDAVTRLIPGVLKSEQSSTDESFTENLLEHPQYTRPEVFEGMKVPEILLSGHHGQIDSWKKEQALKKTNELRPDILKKN